MFSHIADINIKKLLNRQKIARFYLLKSIVKSVRPYPITHYETRSLTWRIFSCSYPVLNGPEEKINVIIADKIVGIRMLGKERDK